MRQTIVIDGNRISSLATFFDEIDSKFIKALDWTIGRNLNAFNDVLRGGFGVHEYEEPIRLVWENSNKSKQVLGWEETIKFVTAKLATCHPGNILSVKDDLELAQQHKGQTLFDLIVDIIRSHEHIELVLN